MKVNLQHGWRKHLTQQKKNEKCGNLTGLSLMNFKQQFKASKYTDQTAKKLEFKKGILSSPNVKPEKGQ
jgi:hypothetical protein